MGIYVLFMIFVAGCKGVGSDSMSKDVEAEFISRLSATLVTSPEPEVFRNLPATSDSLSMDEYSRWLTRQRGLTYSDTENESLRVSLLYTPRAMEAARGMETDSDPDGLKETEALKRDYLYFELSWLDKVVSVRKNAADKERLAGLIRSSLLVETGSGVVYNPIVETFPPVLLNQPGRMLILVPASSFRDWIELRFRGDKLSLADAVLRLTSDDINNLPKLKL